MLPSDRQEFEVQLGELCAAFNVPVGPRADAYWRGLAKMELRTFVRVVEHCLGEEGPDKIPTTKQVWLLSKSMRAKPANAAPAAPPWQGDEWDIEANHRLLARIRANGRRYGPDSHYDPNTHQAIAGPLTRAITAVLVQWKRTWTEDMRCDQPPKAKRSEVWLECMERAEAEIGRILAGNRQAA